MWLRKLDRSARGAMPERLAYSRYYEHDGALRAYANRAMLLALLCVPTALIAVAMAAWVRLAPPTVIRVDAAAAAAPAAPLRISQIGNPEPAAFEKKAYVRLFLDRYLNFSPGTVSQNWSQGLNMMTANLRRGALAAMEKDNTVGRIRDDQITSSFHLRSLEAADDGLSFTAFGDRELHRVRDQQETSDRLVGEIHVRLITERRSEQNPSGLLVADYRERVIEGERRDATGPSVTPATLSGRGSN